MVIVFFYATVFTKIGSGPIWYAVAEGMSEPCKTKWWANLVYLNNIPGIIETQCVGQTWYLATDMQCFILALAVLALFNISLTAGIISASIMIISSMIIKFFGSPNYSILV